MTECVVRAAPAKLNLFLRVLAREADGFHGIETLFCRIDLKDELQVSRRDEPGVGLSVSGADTGPEEDNLAVLAAQMVLTATGRPFGVSLTLEKRIPVRAGLGGGSSDAAAALLAVNQLAGNAVPRHELLQFAARLGSDVPFFLSEAPLALGWGHGERLLRLPALPTRPGLLLIPQVGVETAAAYGWLDAVRATGRRGSVVLGPEALSDWSDVARLAGNDFEGPVFGREPVVRQAFDALIKTNPLMCRMSGSGAAVFAIYRSSAEREDAQMMVSRRAGTAVSFATT